MNSIVRARLMGLVVVLGAFAAGVIVGRRLPQAHGVGVNLTVIQSDRIPAELERLSLTDSQRALIRTHLRTGSRRVQRVVEQFTIPMDAAIDSTDAEIRSVLTPAQNQELDVIRRDQPLKRVRERRVIDSLPRRP